MRLIKFKAWDKKDKKIRIVTRITFGLESTGHPVILVHSDDKGGIEIVGDIFENPELMEGK